MKNHCPINMEFVFSKIHCNVHNLDMLLYTEIAFSKDLLIFIFTSPILTSIYIKNFKICILFLLIFYAYLLLKESRASSPVCSLLTKQNILIQIKLVFRNFIFKLSSFSLSIIWQDKRCTKPYLSLSIIQSFSNL